MQRGLPGPGSTAVVGALEHDVQLVAALRRLLGPDRVHPAVIPAATGIPGQAGISADAPVRLGRDEVDRADTGAGQQPRTAETLGPEPVGIQRGVDARAARAGDVLVDDQRLTARPDREAAEVAAPVAGADALRRAE